MNIIEAFFITLGLDTKDYEKKRKEVDVSLKKFGETSAKQTKLIAEQGKKAAGSFSALKIEILGALAAFGMGAGFKAFVQDSMNGQAAAGRMADALGISVQSMQAYKLMASEMGESGDAAVATLNKVAAGLAAARRGDVTFLANANKYGAGLTLDDNVETTMSKLNKMAFAIREKYGRQQAMGVLGELGIGDFLQQQRLMESPAKFAADYAQALGHGSGMTQQSIEQAKELQKQWAFFVRDMENLRNRIFSKLEPVLIRLGKQLATWLEHVDWDKVINAIGRFIDKVQAIVKDMGGWKRVAEILGAVLALKILAPLLSLTATFARLLPMFVGATTGVAGLAAAFGTLGVALAGVAGYWAGSEIWTHVLAGTKAGDAVGSLAANVMATLGDKDAQDAINRMNGKGRINHSGDYHPERTDFYKQKEKQAVQCFESQGFSRNAAIGMAANIARESDFSQHAVGDHGHAYGIGQWHAARQADFARVMGMPIQGSSYQQQLAFYAYEVKHNKRLMDKLSKNPSAGISAMLVSMLNERPADAQGEAEKRAMLAQKMSNAYIGAPRGTAAAGPKTSTHTVTINGPINVNAPKATNANGVAMGMRKALNDNPLIAGSVTALA